MWVQIAIVGAGPAGFMLGHLPQLQGVEAAIVEARSRRCVEERIRAGVLEQGTADLLNETGVGERLQRDGLLHHGRELGFNGKGFRIDLKALPWKAVTGCRQHEVVKNLIESLLATGAAMVFEAVSDVRFWRMSFVSSMRAVSRMGWRTTPMCLRRVGKVRRLSWWMTSLVPTSPNGNAFDERRQVEELAYPSTSDAAKRSLAENYVGLPLDVAGKQFS